MSDVLVKYIPLGSSKQVLGRLPFLLDSLMLFKGHARVGVSLEVVDTLAKLLVSRQISLVVVAHLGNQLGLLVILLALIVVVLVYECDISHSGMNAHGAVLELLAR